MVVVYAKDKSIRVTIVIATESANIDRSKRASHFSSIVLELGIAASSHNMHV
jgi:hypothetical protein